jgi:hypothetical protein
MKGAAAPITQPPLGHGGNLKPRPDMSTDQPPIPAGHHTVQP